MEVGFGVGVGVGMGFRKWAKIHKRSVFKEYMDWKLTDLSFAIGFTDKHKRVRPIVWKIETLIRKIFKIEDKPWR